MKVWEQEGCSTLHLALVIVGVVFCVLLDIKFVTESTVSRVCLLLADTTGWLDL